MYPDARSVGAWLRGGWHVAVAYVLGFCAMLLAIGWTPDPHAGHADRVAPPSIPKAPSP
jgi:hypothetical protein